MRNFMGKGLTGSEMRRVKRQLMRTRRAMQAERVAQAFWPLFVTLCLIAAAVLLGLFEAFGPVAHRVLLGAAGVAVAAALVLGGMRYRAPTDREIEDRLDASDRRRPLAVLRDELVVGKGERPTETVWAAYRQRARAAAAALMARAPDLRLSSRDRWALRLLAPVLLIGGLIATGGNVSDPIAAVSEPAPVGSATARAAARDPSAEAWAIPPAYTGLATIYLPRSSASEAGAAEPFRIPTGSQVTIRVTDFDGTPTLEGGALAGIESFRPLGGGLAEATGALTRSGTMTVRAGDDALASWQIEVLPDQAPTIELTEPPRATVTRALQLDYEATDDYGVTAAWAEIAPDGYSKDEARGLPLDTITQGLPLPLTGDKQSASDSSIHDYTAHPWAGSEVVVRLYAEDGAGQKGNAAPVRTILPARSFGHPLARALVEQRRELALDYGEAGRVLDVLQAVVRRPEEIFGERMGPYLTVRIAIRRLAVAIGEDDVAATAPDVIELLWEAALGLENGNLADALEKLRQAQEKLREALENGTDEDVRRAMDELRQAMNEYLQQLARQAPQQNPNGQTPPQGQMMTQQDLQQMLDEMQRQAESGARDQARQMLSDLQRMLENMQAMQPGQQQQQGPGQQALQDLQDMIRRQRDLADETFDQMRQRRREQGQQDGQQGQNNQPGQQPGFGQGQGRGREHEGGRQGQGNQRGQQGQGGEGQPQMGQGNRPGQPGAGGGLAQSQEQLRQRLEQLSRGIGSDEAARALEEAVRSMGDARRDLEGGNNSDAIRDQMRALDQLNEGADALAQEIENGQGNQAARGNRRGEGRSRDSETEDPFDRPSASFGAMDGRATKVPDKALVDRARELMEELRRRSAEPERPQLELDYLDRLMERF